MTASIPTRGAIARKKARSDARARIRRATLVDEAIAVRDFSIIVTAATRNAAPWMPGAGTVLVAAVYRKARPRLGSMSLAVFKQTLREQGFAIETVSMPTLLSAAQRRDSLMPDDMGNPRVAVLRQTGG